MEQTPDTGQLVPQDRMSLLSAWFMLQHLIARLLKTGHLKKQTNQQENNSQKEEK